jgi:hypothetical protein
MTDNILDALAKPPPPPSELDELMSRDPLELVKDPILHAEWTAKVIAYQRQARAKREEAPKGRGKRTDLVEHDNAKPIDLAALGLLKPKTAGAPALNKPAPTGGGFRRL